MKKLFSIIAIAALFISIGITGAYAFELPKEAEFYFTNADQSAQYDLDTPYTLGDTPYLYASFYYDALNASRLLKDDVWYENPDAGMPTPLFATATIFDLINAEKEKGQLGLTVSFLIPLTDGASEVGTWNVFSQWTQPFTSNQGIREGAYSVVTPEPISTVLFTVGGIAFIARRKFMGK